MQALYNPTTQTVRTFVVDDHNSRPPAGWQFVDADALPEGWELESVTPVLQWSRTELLALFTREETRLIRSVAMADPESASAIVLDELERRPPDHLYRSDSATLIQLLAALVADGALDSHRPAQILAGVSPS